jgi:carbamoyltransferase
MRVLGISPLDKDSTVSLLEDGRVVFACGEERLSRVKLQSGFPHRALKLGLARTGWDPASIDAVAYAFFDGDGETKLMREAMAADEAAHAAGATADSLRALKAAEAGYRLDRTVPIPGLPTEAAEFMARKAWWKRAVYTAAARSARLDRAAHRREFGKWLAEASRDHHHWTRELDAGLAEYGLAGKLRRFNHHDTHAANSFYASGFDTALLVTLDGYGSGNCGGVYVGDASGIRPLHKFRFPNSLGHFYEQVTSGLGFKPSRHEGKIVGLAAYGNPDHLRKVLLERFDDTDGDIRMRAALNPFFTRALADRFAKRDVAAAYQRVLEVVAGRAVAYWLKKTGLTKVALSGGVNANVKLNQRIREIPGVEAVFVYPNMGDGGCGTGAAMLVCAEAGHRPTPIDTAYHGPDYTDAQVEAALRAEGLAFTRHDDVEEQVADLLAKDCIVGRFAGRMEYGPRALGNRSVLYPAADPEVNQWLNQQLGRTEFMPFAPAALADAAPGLFRNLGGCEKTAEFMTITFDCTDRMKRDCPAAVHVDGTARPQLVSERTNPSFAKILRGYQARTGIGATINTSFNMHEEPIVCSPQDAVRAFLLGNIDYLAIGPYLVPHPKLSENVAGRPAGGSGLRSDLVTRKVGGAMGWGLPGVLKLLPSPVIVPRQQIDRTLALLEPGAKVCDVGAGGRRIRPDVVTVDAFAGPGVDVVGDIHALPIPDASFDCVFCTGTLEHIRNPFVAVQELHRILKPGGLIHIDVPFMQGYHPDPTDYWRFTLDGLRLLCEPFQEVESGTYIGPSCGLVWTAREWANSVSSNKIVSNLLLVPVALLTAPFRYLDLLLIHSRRSHHVASAVFFRGRRRVPEPAPV